MKRLISAVAIATGLAIAAPVVPTAQADTPSCVTRKEFRKAKRGMTKARVHQIFDVAGRRDAISHGGGYSFEIRSYRSCTQFGAVSVGYEKNGRNRPFKLSSKSAVW